MFINTPEKYHLYTLHSDNYWRLTRIFSCKDSLISFLADSVNTHDYEDSARWTSVYFDEINVTGSDMFIRSILTYTRDKNDMLYPIYNVYRYLRTYYFETESGASVDVRNIKEEVFARVRARQAKLISEKRWTYKRWYCRHPKSHTCLIWHTNSHFYRRLRQTHTEEYEDENISIKIKPKPKDIEAKYKWYDDFLSRDETGWKTHKHKHQWEHKLYRKK